MHEHPLVVRAGRAGRGQRMVKNGATDLEEGILEAGAVALDIGPFVAAGMHRSTAGNRSQVPEAAGCLEVPVVDAAAVVGGLQQGGRAGIAEGVTGKAEPQVLAIPE